MIKALNHPSSNGRCKVVAFPVKSSQGDLPHVSASSLKLYLGCSLKYYFKKVLKLPEATSPSLHLGKAVHAGLQAYHKGRWRGESHDLTTVLEAYHQALVEQESSDPVAFKAGEREKLVGNGENLLKAYLDSEHAKVEDLPLGVEVKLEEDFTELPVPLLGYIDLVRPGNVPVYRPAIRPRPNAK